MEDAPTSLHTLSTKLLMTRHGTLTCETHSPCGNVRIAKVCSEWIALLPSVKVAPGSRWQDWNLLFSYWCLWFCLPTQLPQSPLQPHWGSPLSRKFGGDLVSLLLSSEVAEASTLVPTIHLSPSSSFPFSSCIGAHQSKTQLDSIVGLMTCAAPTGFTPVPFR